MFFFIWWFCLSVKDLSEQIMKKLRAAPVWLRLFSLVSSCGGIIFSMWLKHALTKAITTTPIGPTEDRRKNEVAAKRSTYNFCLIATILICCLLNSPLIDSLTFFPISWLLNGGLGICLEKSSATFIKITDAFVSRRRSVQYLNFVFLGRFHIYAMLLAAIFLLCTWTRYTTQEIQFKIQLKVHAE